MADERKPETKAEPESEGPRGVADAAAAADTDISGEAPISVEDLIPGLEDAIAAEDATAELEARAEAAEAERDQMKDRLMRALADAENMRKRAERDRRDAETYGGTRLARDILSLYDNLDRALAAADDDLRESHGSFLEGVELTRKELVQAFAKHRIETLVPEKGQKFDPNRHQAMFEAPIPGAEPGTVIEVMQTGFTIADRLLRPALVGIAKAQPVAAAKPPESNPAED